MILNRMKTKLLQRLDELESRVIEIDNDVSHKNQPLSSDWSEQAVEREEDEVLEALGNASLNEIASVKHALERIEQGTYLQCENCGEDIPEERLELLNFTDLCTPCAELKESKAY